MVAEPLPVPAEPLPVSTEPLPVPALQAKEPKAIIRIDGVNATFQPQKIGNPNGLQITYLKDNSTRSIFVYHDNGKVGR